MEGQQNFENSNGIYGMEFLLNFSFKKLHVINILMFPINGSCDSQFTRIDPHVSYNNHLSTVEVQE